MRRLQQSNERLTHDGQGTPVFTSHHISSCQHWSHATCNVHRTLGPLGPLGSLDSSSYSRTKIDLLLMLQDVL